MENLLTYILQVNLLLALIYLGYRLLLKEMTFYNLNRIYFLIGSVYAFIYPFLNIKSWFTSNSLVQVEYLPVFLEPINFGPVHKASFLSLEDVLLTIVAVGGFVFVSKLLLQLFSLLRIHRYSKVMNWNSYLFRNVLFPVVPFSFFNKIYIHKEQHQENELQDIFAHETIHVRGHHTIDILLFEIILVVCWYNPFVWLMRKAVRQNLEFLTDQQVLNKGVDKQTYQYSLLHVTQQGAAVGISNQFNFKTLKKRIMMMNKKRSSKLELSKYAFLFPVLLIAGMSFTVSKAESGIEEIVDITKETAFIDAPLKVNVDELSSNIVPIDTIKRENEYPLLAPNFNRKELEKGNFHYTIDDKIVSLDEFLEFPRTEIAGVDIYKDAEQIYKKIGKKNSDGLFSMFSKKAEVGNSLKQDTTKSKVIRFGPMVSFNELPDDKKPLIIVDNVIKPLDFDFKSMNPENIESINVLTGESARVKYSDRGKNGAILIKSKKIKDIKLDVKELTFIKTDTTTPIKLIVKDDNGKEVVRTSYSGASIMPQNASLQPLYIVDNEESDIFRLNSLSPDNIESITVLKNENATVMYGDKGKDGVIIITTKKKTNNEVVVTGYKKVNDEKIKSVIINDIKQERNKTPIQQIAKKL